MTYIIFGDVQRLATARGLVMSHRRDGIHLRFRNPETSRQTWSGLQVPEALEIVRALPIESSDAEGGKRGSGPQAPGEPGRRAGGGHPY